MWTTNLACSCQQRGLNIPPSGSNSLACHRTPIRLAIVWIPVRRVPSTEGRRRSGTRLAAAFFVTFPLQCEWQSQWNARDECHVRVLIARRPCLRSRKFWSSRSGLLRSLLHVTGSCVIVCFSLPAVLFSCGTGLACSYSCQHDRHDEECYD